MNKLRQLAPRLNTYKFEFSASLLGELHASTLAAGMESPQYAALHEGTKQLFVAIDSGSYRFQLVSYGASPLLWLSCANELTYRIFRRFAESLDINDELAKLVDCRHGLVMYSGFFVIGNRLDRDNWHVDYYDGANGYTFITPLFDLDPSHGNLLYRDEAGTVHKYTYKTGEGVILGDRFWHSTEPYNKAGKMRVLLSFTIGTDKPEYWPVLGRTIGSQSSFLYLPCGHVAGTCDCCARTAGN
jgi:hypothetical protein